MKAKITKILKNGAIEVEELENFVNQKEEIIDAIIHRNFEFIEEVEETKCNEEEISKLKFCT